MPQGYIQFMPSGRALRYVKPTLSVYQAAKVDKADGTIDLDGTVRQLAFRILTGITAAAVPEVLLAAEVDADGNEVRLDTAGKVVPRLGEDGELSKAYKAGIAQRYLDDQAMAKSIETGAAGGWVTLDMVGLKTRNGDLSFDKLFEDHIGDYIWLQGEVMSLIWGDGRKTPQKARRIPT